MNISRNCTSNKFVNRILLAVLLNLFCDDLLAANFYVRKSGNDGNSGTSPGTAWLTINKAALLVGPGDTVYVGAGVYNEQVAPKRNGTTSNPIRYIADTTGSQTGDAGTVEITYAGTAVSVAQSDNVHFVGFQIRSSVRGVYWRQSQGGRIDSCEIYGNSDFGVEVDIAAVTVYNSIIRNNGSDGLYASGDSDVLVQLCELRNNTGSGASGKGQKTKLTIDRSRLYSNAIDGVHSETGNFTFVNCLVYANGNDGVEVTLGSAASTIQFCTIAANGNDGIRQQTGDMSISNCIVAFNAFGGLERHNGTMTHSYNLVFGNTGGDFIGTTASTGEISVDPNFVSLAGRDFHLNRRSPAINAGTNSSPSVNVDLDGNSRPIGPTFDPGCYESKLGVNPTGLRVLSWKEIQ